MTDNAIVVDSVSKSFHLPHERGNSLKHKFMQGFKKGSYEKQQVLDNISFNIEKGEFFGIVGRNGSGKSTLLKLISGIYAADEGHISVNGKLTPFIELGVGFNPELTGRENVYLSGSLLGFTRKEMGSMYPDIVSFAELERFMDQRLKNYSSGMQVRLAFSIAIRAKSDILILDEVLAVGDAAFQKKCLETFVNLKEEGKTVVLVTHDMGNVERFCDRALVLDKGKILALDTPQEASMLYSKINADTATSQKQTTEKVKNRWGTHKIQVKEVKILNNKKANSISKTGEEFSLNLKIDRKGNTDPVVCGLAFYNADGVNIAGPNNKKHIGSNEKEITFTIPKLPLSAGVYKITIVLFSENLTETFDFLDKWTKFEVIADHETHGVLEFVGKFNECHWQ